jgi:hypothetical protein
MSFYDALEDEIPGILRTNRDLVEYLLSCFPVGLFNFEKINSIKENYEFYTNLKQNPITINGYTIKIEDKKIHEIVPIEFQIIAPNKEIIATFGVHFVKFMGHRELRINMLQGTHKTDLELEFTKALGESWRVFIVKYIKQKWAKENDLVIGELPRKYGILWGQTDSDYLRVLSLYLKTYLRAGLDPKNIDFSQVPLEVKQKFKEWLQNRAKNLEKEKQNPKN